MWVERSGGGEVDCVFMSVKKVGEINPVRRLDMLVYNFYLDFSSFLNSRLWESSSTSFKAWLYSTPRLRLEFFSLGLEGNIR